MEELEVIGKRVNLNVKNLKRVKIISALKEDELNGLNEKKKLDFIVNRAIESYYSSEEIKNLLNL